MTSTYQDYVRRVIQRSYDQQSEREWARMDRHRTEFALTLRALERYLPPPPARVLDCGGGPGRYAIELARQGYSVTLFDLSAGSLKLAREKAQETGVSLAGYEQGTATDLSRFPAGAFEAVLLMGPLYHLLDEAERRQALAEARRALKPGGPLFAAFITRYAPIRYAAAHEPDLVLKEPDMLERILDTGVLPPREEKEEGFVAYFAHPDEVVPLCRSVGLEVQTVWGVEGVVSEIEDDGVNTLQGEAWQAWVEINHRLALDPCLYGGVEHLLAVAVNPCWRAVLGWIARRLDEAGLAYKLVGGASAALHGLPIPVKDLDIETDAEGACRFQDLFPGQVVEPVALRQSQAYRSHLGRFDFDGVPVEVMGDLHRRQGDGWVPSMAQTEALLDLDGLPVRASRLEEETLAYVRRGRLERAAQCLPHCDPDLLLALLRGERALGVL